MTINALNKILTKLISDGCGRRQVCVNKLTFTHPLESDGCNILQVESARIHAINVLDDDGGTKENADGTERLAVVLVLEGDDDREALKP